MNKVYVNIELERELVENYLKGPIHYYDTLMLKILTQAFEKIRLLAESEETPT